MTNREESSAAEHETFPGPGPLKTDEAKRGIRPVEQMVDAAIERIARETQARAARARSSAAGSPPAATADAIGEPGHALTLARSDAAALMALEEGASSSDGGQLALATEKRGKGRLRWKGLDVSDEFRSYAERVARGEDLPPFTGKILAEPDPAFPWDPTAQKRAARRALRHQVGLWSGVAAFLALSVAVLVVQVRKQTDTWQTSDRSPLATVTMANQPSGEVTPSAGRAENAPAAFSETALNDAVVEKGLEPAPDRAAQPAEAAASGAVLGEPRAPAPATAPKVVVAPGTAATQRPVVTAKVAPPAPSSAGVFVATRAAEASTGAGSAAAPGGAAATLSEPALKAIGTAGTPAASGVTASADVAGGSDSASALRADPKKEPTREASGMGSLLVESPSF